MALALRHGRGKPSPWSRGHLHLSPTRLKLCILWIIPLAHPYPHNTHIHTHTLQADTGDNSHWSPSSHPTHLLSSLGPRVCLQIELQDTCGENICVHSLLSTLKVQDEGEWIWKVKRLDAVQAEAQSKRKPHLDPESLEANLRLAWRNLSSEPFSTPWVFPHSTPHPLIFPFPVPFQHLPPTSTNSVASCRNVANVTEL